MIPYLPVYLVIDCSASMYGAPLEAARQMIDILLQLLSSGWMGERQDIGLQLVLVNGQPLEEEPFIPLDSFHLPPLVANGLTPISHTLWRVREAAQALTIDDGRPAPLICLLTDGDATDPDLAFQWRAADSNYPLPRLLIITCGATSSSQLYLNRWQSPVLSSAHLTENQLQRALTS